MKSRVHPRYKTKYRVGNWPAYDRALVQRGDVTLWLTPEAIATWAAVGVGKRGGQLQYSEVAIETALTLRLIFHLPLRQTEGFLRSIFGMLCLDLSAPDHTTELSRVLDANPGLTLVKLADGAKDNWTYLHDALPAGVELVDFYHAVTHLKTTFDAAYGEHTPKARSQFEKYRHVLLEDEGGVAKVIRAFVYLRDQHPRRTKIATALACFRRHRHRMCYATMQARGLPIGSGVVEAACKTLVTQRLKRSGMRWRHAGGQAILTFRSLVQSDRFDHGWQLLSATYRRNVSPPENVVPFPSKKLH